MSRRETCPGCGADKAATLPGCGSCTRAMPENIPGAPSWRITRYQAAAMGARTTVARIDRAVSQALSAQVAT